MTKELIIKAKEASKYLSLDNMEVEVDLYNVKIYLEPYSYSIKNCCGIDFVNEVKTVLAYNSQNHFLGMIDLVNNKVLMGSLLTDPEGTMFIPN